jgi:tetratricopeptide (TPR) repeat protein
VLAFSFGTAREPLAARKETSCPLFLFTRTSSSSATRRRICSGLRNGDADALRRINAVSDRLQLASAQLALAREYGFPSWRRLKSEVERREILASRDLSRLRPLLAEESELARIKMEHWRDHKQALPLGFMAMLRFDRERRGLPRELPGTGGVAQALIDAGAPVDGDPGNKETPLRRAVELYERAIELDPAYDKPNYQLISAHAGLQQPEVSVAIYERRIAGAPSDIREHRFLADAYLKAHAYQQAVEIVEAGLALAPDAAALIELRGEAKAGPDDVEGALGDWRRALELDTESIGALYRSAFLLERKGRPAEAIEAWRAIIELNESRGFMLQTVWPRQELDDCAGHELRSRRAVGAGRDADRLRAGLVVASARRAQPAAGRPVHLARRGRAGCGGREAERERVRVRAGSLDGGGALAATGTWHAGGSTGLVGTAGRALVGARPAPTPR